MAYVTDIANNMGINRMGDPSINYKRKFRYTFSVQPYCAGLGPIEPWFVKTAARPNFSLDETELNFLNEKFWLPNKATYEPITVTYLDVGATEPASQNLYRWLGAAYQFWSPNRKMGTNVNQYGARAALVLYDPCGTPMERWDFYDMWIKDAKFGDLANDSMDVATIELTLRYTKFNYTALCGNVSFQECCTGCNQTQLNAQGVQIVA
jgi:hypothetical protein